MTPKALQLQQARVARLELINRPLPRIKAFDTHTRTARWAGCQITGPRAHSSPEPDSNAYIKEDQ